MFYSGTDYFTIDWIVAYSPLAWILNGRPTVEQKLSSFKYSRVNLQ
jgi:hypothetical protein